MKLVVGLVVSVSDDLVLTLEVIKSLINQTDREFNTLVLFNGFNEIPRNIEALLAGLSAKIIIDQEQKFFYQRLNELMSWMADDEVFVRVDADDICLPHRIAMTRNAVLRCEQKGKEYVVYGGAWEITASGSRGLRRTIDVRKHFSGSKLSNPIVHSTVAFPVHAVRRAGGYPPFQKAQDLALWIKLYTLGFYFEGIERPVVYFMLPQNPGKKRGLKYFKSELDIYIYALRLKYVSPPKFVLSSIKKFTIRSLFTLTPDWLSSRIIDEIIKYRHNKL